MPDKLDKAYNYECVREMVQKTQVKNLYELLIVLKSDLSEDELEKNISLVESSVKNYGGQLLKVDDPIRRRFTHPMKGNKEGYYISMSFNSPKNAPNNLKKTLAITDDVLRYMVVRKEAP